MVFISLFAKVFQTIECFGAFLNFVKDEKSLLRLDLYFCVDAENFNELFRIESPVKILTQLFVFFKI